VAGLYCYEKQIPAVSASKIAGLESNYGLSDPATLRYFKVHETADIEHAAQWESVLACHEVNGRKAEQVADEVLDALWASLDEMYDWCALATQPARVRADGTGAGISIA
jgi:pyrroloquinoline-quinone synthase